MRKIALLLTALFLALALSGGAFADMTLTLTDAVEQQNAGSLVILRRAQRLIQLIAEKAVIGFNTSLRDADLSPAPLDTVCQKHAQKDRSHAGGQAYPVLFGFHRLAPLKDK